MIFGQKWVDSQTSIGDNFWTELFRRLSPGGRLIEIAISCTDAEHKHDNVIMETESVVRFSV